jgi:hypothetical protein
MKEYSFLMTILSAIYIGFLFVQAREKKMARRYYGYRSSRSRSSRQLKKAA